jgi:hypothetical protein
MLRISDHGREKQSWLDSTAGGADDHKTRSTSRGQLGYKSVGLQQRTSHCPNSPSPPRYNVQMSSCGRKDCVACVALLKITRSCCYLSVGSSSAEINCDIFMKMPGLASLDMACSRGGQIHFPSMSLLHWSSGHAHFQHAP